MGLLTILVELALLGILGIFAYLWYKNYSLSQYFKKRGIPYFGAGYPGIIKMLMGKTSLPDIEVSEYMEMLEMNSPLVGYADSLVSPGVYIMDLDLRRSIFVKDFDNFINRRSFDTQTGDQLFKKMVAFMENEQWKGVRSKLSPTFTTGKIRKLFDIFLRSSDRMCDYIKERVGPTGMEFDMNDVYSKYAMDAIASCVFGVNSKSFESGPGKSSKFVEMAKRLQFKFEFFAFLKVILISCAPKLADMLGLQLTDPVPGKYFTGLIMKVLNHRRETGERQNDFLQLMMDVQEGLLKGEENSHEVLEVMTGTSGEDIKSSSFDNLGKRKNNDQLSFEDDDIVANCVLFLVAGFDTLHSLLIFSAYALALHQDVQQKLLEEIQQVVNANGGKLTYDGVHEMKYLDMFINETLRYYPPALRAERMCTKRYVVPGSTFVIEKGVIVALPIIGLHRDPRYFQNPEKFDPERFTPEIKSERHPYAFSPFGHGPRNCLGMRFALTEAKTVICSLVQKFQLEPCSKTEVPLKFGNSTTTKPLNGIWVNIRQRKDS